MYMYMYMYIQDQEHSHEFTWQFTRELNFTKIYVKKARFKRISMWNFRGFFYEALEPEVVLYFSVFSYLLALIFDIFT